MDYNQYLDQIIAFNSDKKVVALREKFNKASFFEIISKERSETTYSAFLKWLFLENATVDEACSPLAFLLDILVRRCEEQMPEVDTILKKADVKKCIVTRRLSMDSIKIGTEVPVSVLTQAIVNSKPRLAGVLQDPQLQKIAANSQDRIDLVIECEIKAEDIKAKKLQIIIENKIDSSEGGKKNNKITGVPAYDDASQTTRYYLGTKFSSIEYGVGTKEECDGLETLQLYVYLTPESQHSAAGIDSHFIKISYQDIVDGILMPMLSSSNLSSRRRFFLEEFLNQLVYPSLNGTSMRPSIAIGKEHSAELSEVWNKFQPLLTDSAIAAAESNLWKVGDTFFDHQPRAEVLTLLLDKDVQHPEIINGQWKPNLRYSRIQEIAQSFGIETEAVSLSISDSCKELLSAFWDKNRRLLTALLSGIEEKDDVFVLTQEVAQRDTTRYTVFYDGNVLSNLSQKGVTAWVIVAKWAQLYKASGAKLDLESLRKTFPRTCNPYYEQGKWYKHLFYPKDACIYDGEKGDGSVPTSHWDIDFNGKYDIQTDDGPVVFLKMWRKDALEHFIEKAEAMPIFHGKLSIVSE